MMKVFRKQIFYTKEYILGRYRKGTVDKCIHSLENKYCIKWSTHLVDVERELLQNVQR